MATMGSLANRGSARSARGRLMAVHDRHLACPSAPRRRPGSRRSSTRRLAPVRRPHHHDARALEQLDRDLLVDLVVLDQQHARPCERRRCSAAGRARAARAISPSGRRIRPTSVSTSVERLTGLTRNALHAGRLGLGAHLLASEGGHHHQARRLPSAPLPRCGARSRCRRARHPASREARCRKDRSRVRLADGLSASSPPSDRVDARGRSRPSARPGSSRAVALSSTTSARTPVQRRGRAPTARRIVLAPAPNQAVNAERAALARLALHARSAPPISSTRRLRDREAEAGAAVLAGRRAVRLR